MWEGEVYVNFQQNRDFKNKFLCSKTKIEICLQKFSTDQRFQKQIFCVAKLKMILKVVFISKTSLCFFEKLWRLPLKKPIMRRCLEKAGVYVQRLLEDEVNKKKSVYWRIYHILAFLYSFILDVHEYFGLKLHSQILSMFICLLYYQVLSNTIHTLVYSSSMIIL